MVEKSTQRLSRRAFIGLGAGIAAGTLVGCGSESPKTLDSLPNPHELKPSKSEQELWTPQKFLPQEVEPFNKPEVVVSILRVRDKMAKSENPYFKGAADIYLQLINAQLLTIEPVNTEGHAIMQTQAFYNTEKQFTGYSIFPVINTNLKSLDDISIAFALAHEAHHIAEMSHIGDQARAKDVPESDVSKNINTFMYANCTQTEQYAYGAEVESYMAQKHLMQALNLINQEAMLVEYKKAEYNSNSASWKNSVARNAPNCAR